MSQGLYRYHSPPTPRSPDAPTTPISHVDANENKCIADTSTLPEKEQPAFLHELPGKLKNQDGASSSTPQENKTVSFKEQESSDSDSDSDSESDSHCPTPSSTLKLSLEKTALDLKSGEKNKIILDGAAEEPELTEKDQEVGIAKDDTLKEKELGIKKDKILKVSVSDEKDKITKKPKSTSDSKREPEHEDDGAAKDKKKSDAKKKTKTTSDSNSEPDDEDVGTGKDKKRKSRESDAKKKQSDKKQKTKSDSNSESEDKELVVKKDKKRKSSESDEKKKMSNKKNKSNSNSDSESEDVKKLKRMQIVKEKVVKEKNVPCYSIVTKEHILEYAKKINYDEKLTIDVEFCRKLNSKIISMCQDMVTIANKEELTHINETLLLKSFKKIR